MLVDACIQGRPCVGESRSGDAGLVHVVEAVTWVLLVDALGHGNEAADIADMAVEEAAGFDADHSVEQALSRLHTRLDGTRGAAVALLRFDGGGLSLGGVGNVEVRTLRGPAAPYVPMRGILGRRMPEPRALQVELTHPGRLLLYTDGIARRVPLTSLAVLDGETLCRTLIEEHALDRDDATVIHVHYSP